VRDNERHDSSESGSDGDEGDSEHSRRERGGADDGGDSTRTVCGKSRANAASWPSWEPMTAKPPT
jgi:hypothetical protein